jgi:hypothetical protein
MVLIKNTEKCICRTCKDEKCEYAQCTGGDGCGTACYPINACIFDGGDEGEEE